MTSDTPIAVEQRGFLPQVAGWTAVCTAFCLPLSTTLTNIFFIAVPLLSLASGRWKEKGHFLLQRRALFLLPLLFAWMLIGVLYTTAPFSEACRTLIKYDTLLLGIFFVPIFREEKWRRYALYAFFAAILVTLAAACCKEIHLLTLPDKFGRFLVFKDRIQTSFLMAITAYFAGAFFFDAKTKATRWGYALFFSVCVFFLFSIDGRSGYVVFFALFTWLLWSHWRWKGLAICVGAVSCILLLAYLFSPAFNSRLQESIHDIQIYQTGENNTSLGLRTEFAKNSLTLIKTHPLFGTGTGSFATQYASLHMPDYLKTRNPHNQYIHILVQWGVVGLGIFLWLLYVQWKDSAQLPLLFRQIAQGTVLTIAIGSLANSWLLDTTEGHFYVYFIALAFASQMVRSKHARAPSSK